MAISFLPPISPLNEKDAKIFAERMKNPPQEKISKERLLNLKAIIRK